MLWTVLGIRFSASARPMTVRGAVNLERFSHREPSSSTKKRKLAGHIEGPAGCGTLSA
jgi:hypothetical protein